MKTIYHHHKVHESKVQNKDSFFQFVKEIFILTFNSSSSSGEKSFLALYY